MVWWLGMRSIGHSPTVGLVADGQPPTSTSEVCHTRPQHLEKCDCGDEHFAKKDWLSHVSLRSPEPSLL
jgi:hypothetical protein